MKNIFDLLTSHTEKQILTQDFNSLDKAIELMNSFDYGVIKKSQLGEIEFTNGGEEYRDQKNDLHFESQNEDAFYYYTIEIHLKFYRLLIKKTNRHKMVTAAETGNIDMFIENFSDTDKMKGFALSTAIINEQWGIVKHLIDNYDLKNKPLWDAIRYNKTGIVVKLLDHGHQLPKDWLAYCLYNDSIDVINELLIKRKSHLTFTSNELKTSWFKNEITKQSKSVELVRKIIE